MSFFKGACIILISSLILVLPMLFLAIHIGVYRTLSDREIVLYGASLIFVLMPFYIPFILIIAQLVTEALK